MVMKEIFRVLKDGGEFYFDDKLGFASNIIIIVIHSGIYCYEKYNCNSDQIV